MSPAPTWRRPRRPRRAAPRYARSAGRSAVRRRVFCTSSSPRISSSACAWRSRASTRRARRSGRCAARAAGRGRANCVRPPTHRIHLLLSGDA
eukprot:972220-Prymnesium_polylepis.1